jgi:hypothetical protein
LNGRKDCLLSQETRHCHHADLLLWLLASVAFDLATFLFCLTKLVHLSTKQLTIDPKYTPFQIRILEMLEVVDSSLAFVEAIRTMAI